MGVEPCSLGFEQSEEGKKASLKRPKWDKRQKKWQTRSLLSH